MKEKKVERLTANLLLLAICGVMMVPVYFLLNNALKQKEFIYKAPMVLNAESFTLENITKAFSLMKFPQAALNSTAVLVLSCGGLILLGSLASYAISLSRSAWARKLYVVIVALVTVPVSCAQIPLARELSALGLINTWLGTSLVYVAFGLPFAIFIFTGYSQSIPGEIWEAAEIDGCGPLQSYVRIYMPLIKMTTATIIIMRGSYIWNDILVPLITISTGAQQTLPQKLVSFAGANVSRWELMFAATLLISLPNLILYLCLQKVFVSALTAGAVKG